MKATHMMAQCTRRSPKRAMSVVAMRVAPPDSAIILPSMVPSPTTTAMKPNEVPTPSWNAFTAALSGIPAATPSPMETVMSATKGCSLKRAMATMSAITAPSA